MVDYLPKAMSDDFMGWLTAQSPDRWHQVAQEWNWDSGERPLIWIAAQPECDRATALAIFWLGDPTYYWSDPPERIAEREASIHSDEDAYRLIADIARRWRGEGFARSEIAYNPGHYGVRREFIARSTHHPTLAIDETMIAPLPGRSVDRIELGEGIPMSIWQAHYPPG